MSQPVEACPRCLGATVIITFDGKGGYRCPACAPAYMRKAAVDLDNINTLRKLEAIDALVDAQLSEELRWAKPDPPPAAE